MRIYIHEGKGYFIGSTIIVQAASKKVASGIIRKELDRCGLKDEELKVRLHPKTEKIIYVDNGDY